MQSQSFPYRTNRPFLMVIGALFFAGCAYFMYLKSQSNARGLILNHIVELSAADASLFYLALALASVTFVLMSVALLLLSLFARRFVEITPAHLSVPRGLFSLSNAIIPWESITGLRDIAMSGHHWLDVFHAGGKVRIAESMLGADEFATVQQLVRGTLDRIHRPGARV